jgi:hypothetical protein
MSREEHKDAIEVSIIFHEGQRMFAVPKQPAPDLQANADHAVKCATEAIADADGPIKAVREYYGAQPPTKEFVCSTGLCHYKAQPTPVKPVATLWRHGETGRTRITMPGDITDCDARWFKAADLYTTPPAAPVQEPVGEVIGTNASFGKIKDVKTIKWLVEPLPAGTKLYTTPPAAQRQWVDLTDEQRSAIIRHHSFAEDIIRVTAAKLKEKNYG